MKVSDTLAGVIGLFFSAFVYWRTLSFTEFVPNVPGPRFFPQLIALLIGGLSVCLLFQSIFGKGEISSNKETVKEIRTKKGATFIKVLSAMAGSIAYYFLMKEIGFLISTFLYFCFLMFLMQEKRRILETTLYASSVTAVAYVIFAVFLKASLPIGAIFR